MTARSWKERLEHLAARARRPTSRRAQLWVFSIASLGFVIGAVFAVRSFPHTHHPANYFMLGAVVLLGPATAVVLNSGEFLLSASLLSQKVTIGYAARIAVLGTAANQLPVPGAVIVRTQALATGGARYRKALLASLAIGLAWIGSSFTMAGLLQFHGKVPALGLAFAAGGVVLLVGCQRIVRGVVPPDAPRFMTARIIGIETTLVIVQAIRLYLVLRGFGVAVSPAQAVALAVAGVLASALGVVPGGVGIREALAAGIGPLVGIPVSASIIATAFDRIADLVVVGIAAIVLTIVTRRSGEPAGINPIGER